MSLAIYNTLTRRIEPFEPLEAGTVRMYCCGVTVYDYCHLGHARSYLVWDILRRYLEWRGYRVHYVQNFTDIDDKILARARQEGSSMQAVTERFMAAYFQDMDRLGIRRADAYPRPTASLDGIKALVASLQKRGYAYAAAGDVYYAVRQFPAYGKLSGRSLAELEVGASGRVAAEGGEAPQKQDPFDFALWKQAKPDEPAWDSPWGPGRPGWHIECSAMVRETLGETIDIHAGGGDLLFPHHENEIAQSEAATGRPLARYWMHNGMVQVGGEKMAKSLGNFTTVRDLLDRRGTHPMALRLFVLQAHYRKPLDFTAEGVETAHHSWQTLKEGLQFGRGRLASGLGFAGGEPPDDPASARREELDADAVARFNAAMDDDINTPGGLAVLFDLAKTLRRAKNQWLHQGQTASEPVELERKWRTLVCLGQVLGLAAQHSEQPGSVGEEADGSASSQLSDDRIEALVRERAEARKAKNFAQADRIRDQLQAQGIAVVDLPGGETRWYRQA
ncbi:MAG: cysteine--tRNA ligase [Cyanobacteria bacterium QS_8_64_29]|nr:MAG: cysteine--tRNA ligase [Cyanobacteria bacterium QS_8_64_29]